MKYLVFWIHFRYHAWNRYVYRYKDIKYVQQVWFQRSAFDGKYTNNYFTWWEFREDVAIFDPINPTSLVESKRSIRFFDEPFWIRLVIGCTCFYIFSLKTSAKSDIVSDVWAVSFRHLKFGDIEQYNVPICAKWLFYYYVSTLIRR